MLEKTEYLNDIGELTHFKLKERLLPLLLRLIPQWRASKASRKDISIVPIKTGLTNQLFCASNSISPTKVLVRFFGKGRLFLFESDQEQRAFHVLSKAGLAPKLIAQFANGRIEGWKEGRSLTHLEFSQSTLLLTLAKQLSSFHTTLSSITELSEIFAFEPQILIFLKRSLAFVEQCYTNTNKFDDSVHQNMLSMLRTSIFKELSELNLPQIIYETKAALTLLNRFAGNEQMKKNHFMQLTFCHNDIHSQNIMIHNNELSFVDFEFAGYNYPAYEIAVIFVEMITDYTIAEPPFFSFDTNAYSFPDREFICLFCTEYLNSFENRQNETKPVDIENAVSSVMFMSLYVNLFGVFWALIITMTCETGKSFDYFFYAKQKFSAYLEMKQRLSNEHII